MGPIQGRLGNLSRARIRSVRYAGLTLVAFMLLLVGSLPAAADTTAQTLPFTQDWGDTALITTNDDWSGAPGVIGYRGDALVGSAGADPQTITADGSGTPVDVNANQPNPNTFTTGGVSEFELLADPVVALQGSGTADAPHLVLTLDTTDKQEITVSYNLRDIDGSADNAVQQVALQYRVGFTGSYTNLPAGYVADATTGPSLATQVTPVSVMLPAPANDQPLVQVRVITADAAGSDEWVGVDDISVTAGDEPPPDAAPSVTGTSPASGAVNVHTNANIGVTFSEPVSVSTATFSIACATSGTHLFALSGSGASYSLNPDADFAHGETCTVTIAAAEVADADSNDPPDTMDGDHSFSFTALGPPSSITQIQGESHISPLVGRPVSAVEGIVTARRIAGGRGIWIQDPVGDGSKATSNGLFVFTGATPTAQIGDRVRVKGTVTEFRGGCADPCTPAAGSGFNNLTITQITTSNADVEVLSSGNAIPGPTVLGFGGRKPPTRTIDDDTRTTRDVEVSNDFDPSDDAIDFYESLEGMIVQVNDGAVVGPTKSFGEITLLPDSGRWATGLRTPRGGILYSYADGNPERIAVDDEILRDLITPRPGIAMPNMDVGAKVTSPVVGPLDYTFANYKIQATTPLTFLPSTIAREEARTPRKHELAVATFNVENLTVGDPQQKFDELAEIILRNLKAPDLIGIEEVQDDSGAPPPASEDNGVVDASQTWAKLIAAIEHAGGPLYEYRQINPLNNADGGAPGGNIRVGFLFRTDRGLSFVDRPGGDATTPTAVVADGPRTPRLTLSPGRIDPANPAYIDTRKSLAGEFRYRGETIFAVVVHFSSKGDDQPLFGRFQPPTRFSEVARHGQAEVVNDFADDILDIDRKAKVVVMGDVNDFEFSETVDILEGRELTTFMRELRRNQRYSYVFEGNSQTLDQILGSDSVLGRLVEYDVVRVNAEFAVQASDHDPSVARIHLAGDDDDDDDDDDD